ncbi:MAG: DUF3488 domain-containing transglutaminase family protein [Nitrospirae bacterium]|nr:DUF3488 domain-containing transglutaminase family protein [Nitrospirota bacterium]
MESKNLLNAKTRLKVENLVKGFSYAIGVVGFLSVARDTGITYNLLFISLSVFAVYRESRLNLVIPRWAINIISFLLIALALMRMTQDNMVVPALESLIALLGVKFVEEKKFRDYMQVYAISIFLLAGSALLSLDMLFLTFFFSLVFLITMTVVLLTYYSEDSAMELQASTAIKIVYRAVLITLISIPITIFFFIILPRTNYPLLNFLNRAATGMSGFTDSITLGEISDIFEDNTVLFRVKMNKVDDKFLYWRGIVLDHFDGRTWRSMGAGEEQKLWRTDLRGVRIFQSVFLEPYNNRYFFGLDKPTYVHYPKVKRFDDLTFRAPENVMRKIKYDAISILSDTMPANIAEANKNLQLPFDKLGTLSKVKELAGSIVENRKGENAVNALQHYLNSGAFRYSIRGMPVSKKPLEEFLFDRKEGSCEYYASAMAVMLRLSGIPARLVGGFRGGDYNDIGGYYMVPQKYAHVWVEAYIEGKGWKRIEPTPAGSGISTVKIRKGFLRKLQFFIDSINYYWSAAVINYNLEKQINIVGSLMKAFKQPSLRLSLDKGEAARTSLLIIATAAFAGLLVILLKRKRQSPEDKILNSFLAAIGKHGYRKSSSEGLEEFVAKIRDPHIRKDAATFVSKFQQFYYRDLKIGKDELNRLADIITKVKRRRADLNR